MRIVIVGTAYPYRGGLAAFNERLAQQFSKDGDDVRIETFTLQYPSFLFPGKTQYSSSPAPNISIRRSINSLNPINWYSIGRDIAKSQPDIVIFSYWMSFMAPCFGSIALSVKKHTDAKCIGLIHNMIPHEQGVIDKILPRYFVSHMDGFVALSKSVIHDIEKFDTRNSPKIYSPHPIYDHYGEIMECKHARNLLKVPPDKPTVLFFGFIREYKGLDILLKAADDERIRALDVQFIIAGEFYGNESYYKNLTEELRIENIHWFSEYIPDEEVNRYFSAADLVVQPYKTATQSGVTQICYHFEKPMIVTNVGGLSEIVIDKETGFVVDTSSKNVADAIIRFFNDTTTDYKKNLQREKKKYSWSILTDKLRVL